MPGAVFASAVLGLFAAALHAFIPSSATSFSSAYTDAQSLAAALHRSHSTARRTQQAGMLPPRIVSRPRTARRRPLHGYRQHTLRAQGRPFDLAVTGSGQAVPCNSGLRHLAGCLPPLAALHRGPPTRHCRTPAARSRAPVAASRQQLRPRQLQECGAGYAQREHEPPLLPPAQSLAGVLRKSGMRSPCPAPLLFKCTRAQWTCAPTPLQPPWRPYPPRTCAPQARAPRVWQRRLPPPVVGQPVVHQPGGWQAHRYAHGGPAPARRGDRALVEQALAELALAALSSARCQHPATQAVGNCTSHAAGLGNGTSLQRLS